jgi:hypothetical protein
MKLPKLKYYYLPMTSDAYIDFATRRVVEVAAAYSIDLITGGITGTTRLILSASVPDADNQFRKEHSDYTRPVYVLRIPHTAIDRKYLAPVGDNRWSYTRTLHIDHCGVERIEYDPESAASSTKVIDTAELKHI